MPVSRAAGKHASASPLLAAATASNKSLRWHGTAAELERR